MADRFNAGQIWRTQGRPQDGDVQILILAITDNKVVGPIYSIALTGVRIRNPRMEGGLQTVLPHVPVTEEMLRAAATELVASDGPTADHPDFSESYLEFRELYDLGEAGVFTLTFPEIVDLVEKATASTET